MNDNREPKSNSLSQDEPRMAIVHGPGSAHNPRIIFRRQLILELSISPDEQRVLAHNHRRRRKRLRVVSNRPLTRLDSVGHFFDRISFNRCRILRRKHRRCACAELPDLVPAVSPPETRRTSVRNTTIEATTRETTEGRSEISAAAMEPGEILEAETETRQISPRRKLGVYRISETQLESRTPKEICKVNWTEYIESLRSLNWTELIKSSRSVKNPEILLVFSPLLGESFDLPIVNLPPRLAKIMEPFETTFDIPKSSPLRMSTGSLALLKLALQTPQFYFLLRRSTASYFDFFMLDRLKHNFCGRCAARLPEMNQANVLECHMCGLTVTLPPKADPLTTWIHSVETAVAVHQSQSNIAEDVPYEPRDGDYELLTLASKKPSTLLGLLILWCFTILPGSDALYRVWVKWGTTCGRCGHGTRIKDRCSFCGEFSHETRSTDDNQRQTEDDDRLQLLGDVYAMLAFNNRDSASFTFNTEMT